MPVIRAVNRHWWIISAVPIIHEKTHLPIIVDPSHATGKADLVAPMAYAATAAGADGIVTGVLTPAGALDTDALCPMVSNL